LKEQEEMLLAQLEQVSQELVSRSCEYNTRLSERESLLDTVIAQIQEKQDQPALEFLMVRLHYPLGSVTPGVGCEAAKAPIPEPLSPELQRNIENLSETSQLVLDVVAKFKEVLILSAGTDCCFCHPLEKVTLDPDTASPHLTLSQDRKTVWLGDETQNLPDTSKRFMGSPSVLGSQG
ncbi:TRI15 protein, partial [Origma solitaria]|nr:TRI15 protein [Origma solitaria]